MSSEPIVGYVLKVYPRFSETFVVSEILAREAAGERIVVFALRPTTDARFHPELARVAAPVVHIGRPSSAKRLWEGLGEAFSDESIASDAAHHLGELVAANADDAAQAVAVAAAAHRYGVTHLHAHFGSVATTVARLAGRVGGLPYSFTAHAKDIFHETVRPEDLATKLGDAHHVVTVSDYNLAHLTDRFPAETTRLHRVYNGIELDRFPYRPSRRRTDPPRLIAIGRLVEKKGFDLLVHAVVELRDRGTEVRAQIVGDGDQHEPLSRLIGELGVGDLVELTGPLPQDEVAALMRDSDVLVAPFVVGSDGNADGLPTVLLEAMASGLPCIAADVTGVPEAIRDAETGLLVRTGDLEHLVETIETVTAPGFDPRPLTDKARRLVEDQFDSARQAADLARLLTRPEGGAR